MNMPPNDADQPPGAGGPGSVDLYREVHKGLRLALFELVRTAGALDPADRASCEAFAQLFADIDMMLQTHHTHEDGESLGTLIRASAPAAVVEAVDTDHELTEQMLSELRALVADLSNGVDNTRAIYDAVTTFVTSYLGHMEVEERQVMPALQAHASFDDLKAIEMGIRTSIPPPDMCVFMRYMLPAMNPDERTSMLGGMKMGAPPEIFQMFWETAEACLSSADVATVSARLPG